MYKVIVTTVLDPKIKAKLSEYSKETYIPYSKLIESAINAFNKKLKKSKKYTLKHADFDRIKTQSFSCSVPNEVNELILGTANELEISKRMLLREIITEFVLDLK